MVEDDAGQVPPRSILVQYYAQPGRAAPVARDGATVIFAGGADPSVHLEAVPDAAYRDGRPPRRLEAQRRRLPRLQLEAPDPLFGASLDWPFRAYRVNPPPAGATPGPRRPLGLEPERPSSAPAAAAAARHTLCLFSIIVALEWYPDAATLLRLEWACRRASDFLYDVTDGAMAIGQVAVGGPEWLAGADIQLLASNRFHPRSWTDGLHEEAKFSPIRAGRGLWSKRGRLSIPWDEPEGYRTLVHEWGHYALGLKDAYLLPVPVAPVGGGLRLVPSDEPTPLTLIVPQVSPPVQSIMAGQQGTSELAARRTGASRSAARSEERAAITAKPAFAGLDLLEEAAPLAGPWRLPLPLPTFQALVDPLADEARPGPAGLAWGGAMRLSPPWPTGLDPEHGWVYLLKGTLERPGALLAQGTLDRAASEDGFLLLGAAAGDWLIVVGDDVAGQPRTWRGRLADDGTVAGWAETTPPAWPAIDVVPRPGAPVDASRPVEVSLAVDGDAAPPERVWLFPVGQPECAPILAWSGEAGGQSTAGQLDSLDGHLLAIWADGGLLVGTHSQGGGPASSGGLTDNPTTGGSAEGNAMLFFQAAPEEGARYSHLRVVTTLLPGEPGAAGGGRHGRRPHSYAFSLASNEPLPTELNPTLVLFFEPFPGSDDGELLIHRHLGGDRWEPLPTYVDPGAWLAATPLHEPAAGGRLIDHELDRQVPRAERYRLFWRRRERG